MQLKISEQSLNKLVWGVLIAILCIVAFNQLTLTEMTAVKGPRKDQPCEGQPIHVDYAYDGGMVQPHACAEQCDDQVLRYIVYTDGEATQCAPLPGCSDWGEDMGITCVIETEKNSEDN